MLVEESGPRDTGHQEEDGETVEGFTKLHENGKRCVHGCVGGCGWVGLPDSFSLGSFN